MPRLILTAFLAGLILLSDPVRALSLDEFQQHFRDTLVEHGVPGGAYAVVHNGEIERVGTYGIRRVGSHTPITADTVFRTASVSKTFAAQLTSLLVAENLLHWEDPVTTYLPDFRLKDPSATRQLKLHHLVGQSTGIVSNAYDNLLNANQSLERILPKFAELEPLCEPGSCYTYQNVLFAMVEPAIEQTTGQNYEVLLEERLFKPLNMHRSSVGFDAYLAEENRATPHIRLARGRIWHPVSVEESYYLVPPAAGVNATVLDLARWLNAQQGYRPDILPPDTIRPLTEKRVRTLRDLRRGSWKDLLTDAHYGLGWRIYTVDDEDIYLHSGWVQGFVADISYSLDRKVGLVLLLNGESRALSEITTGFWAQQLAEPRPAVALGRGSLETDQSR
ncbi:MAG: serine hydrolase domain-containing protein [Wenzhouxiangella sp.]|jgi:beta-lactamase class C|nr:serine hydrolase domain-containing protein [Wenzhouxiangella sp.]